MQFVKRVETKKGHIKIVEKAQETSSDTFSFTCIYIFVYVHNLYTNGCWKGTDIGIELLPCYTG